MMEDLRGSLSCSLNWNFEKPHLKTSSCDCFSSLQSEAGKSLESFQWKRFIESHSKPAQDSEGPEG